MLNNRNINFQYHSGNHNTDAVRAVADNQEMTHAFPSLHTHMRTIVKVIVAMIATMSMAAVTSALPTQKANAATPVIPSLPDYIDDNNVFTDNSHSQLKWTTIPELSAEWMKDPQDSHRTLKLHSSSVYWSTSQSLGLGGNKDSIVLGESYGLTRNAFSVSSDNKSETLQDTRSQKYATRPVLKIHIKKGYTSPISTDNNNNIFNQVAVGRINRYSIDNNGNKVYNENAPMGVYFWNWASDRGANAAFKSGTMESKLCTSLPNGGDPNGSTTPILRIQSGSSNIQVGCMPNHVKLDTQYEINSNYNYFNDNNDRILSQIVAGQVDSKTGFIYFRTDRAAFLDAYGEKSSMPNANLAESGEANAQFVIWDPISGTYVLSGPIQPQTIYERKKYFLNYASWREWISNENYNNSKLPTDDNQYYGAPDSDNNLKQNGLEASNQSYRPSQGFILLGDGDILTISNVSTCGRKGHNWACEGLTAPNQNNNFLATLVRIHPLKNQDGNYVQTNPLYNNEITWGIAKRKHTIANTDSDLYVNPQNYWTYRVVSKFDRQGAPDNLSDTSWDMANGDFGSMAVMDGQIVINGRNMPGHCTSDNKDKDNPLSSTPARMIYANIGYRLNHSKTSNAASSYSHLSPISSDINYTEDSNGNIVKSDNSFGSSPGTSNSFSGDNYTLYNLTSSSGENDIHGYIYWDKTGHGQVTDTNGNITAPGFEGATVALYQGDAGNTLQQNPGKLVAITETGKDGSYEFAVPSEDSPVSGVQYTVRVVEPQVPGDTSSSASIYKSDTDHSRRDGLHNAVQTWTGFSASRENTAEAWCPVQGDKINDKENIDSLGNVSGHCTGREPYIDPPLSTMNANYDIASYVPIRTLFNVYGYLVDNQNTNSAYDSFNSSVVADFAISAGSSFGDSPHPPFNTTVQQQGPYLSSIDPSSLHLGNMTGTYGDGVNNSEAADHRSDDGVTLSEGSFGAGDSNGINYGETPTLKVVVRGHANQKFQLRGWLAEVNSSSPQLAFYGSGILDDSGQYTINPAWTVSKISSKSSASIRRFRNLQEANGTDPLDPGDYILRVIVMPDNMSTNVPDNTTGAFNGPAFGSNNANSQYWINPGEIEDYFLQVKGTTNYVRFQSLIEGTNGKSLNDPVTVSYTDGTNTVQDIIKQYNVFSPNTSDFTLTSPTFTQTGTSGDQANHSGQFAVKFGSGKTETFSTTFKNGQGGLWYDDSYINKKGNDSQSGQGNKDKPYTSGVACFERDQTKSIDPENAGFPIKIDNVEAEEGHPIKITLSKDEVNTKASIARTIVTCQVPFTYSRFTLPFTGRTIPWASVVGMTVLLLGIAGIAIVLVRRK